MSDQVINFTSRTWYEDLLRETQKAATSYRKERDAFGEKPLPVDDRIPRELIGHQYRVNVARQALLRSLDAHALAMSDLRSKISVLVSLDGQLQTELNAFCFREHLHK